MLGNDPCYRLLDKTVPLECYMTELSQVLQWLLRCRWSGLAYRYHSHLYMIRKKDRPAKNITPRTGSPALEGIIEEQDDFSPPRSW
jgi:hypothetical protein